MPRKRLDVPVTNSPVVQIDCWLDGDNLSHNLPLLHCNMAVPMQTDRRGGKQICLFAEVPGCMPYLSSGPHFPLKVVPLFIFPSLFPLSSGKDTLVPPARHAAKWI